MSRIGIDGAASRHVGSLHPFRKQDHAVAILGSQQRRLTVREFDEDKLGSAAKANWGNGFREFQLLDIENPMNNYYLKRK